MELQQAFLKQKAALEHQARRYEAHWEGICWYNTVDGWNPAPIDREFIPLFTGFYTSHVVPDFIGACLNPVTVVKWEYNDHYFETVAFFASFMIHC